MVNHSCCLLLVIEEGNAVSERARLQPYKY